MHALLDRLFQLQKQGTGVRTEVLGGATTFVTMAYIIVVNPAILEAAGLPRGPSTVATILVAVFGSLLMGLYANRPIAVAPYMGENAFIAYSLVAAKLLTWQEALGAVFVSGAAFLVLTVLGVRSWLAHSVSSSMRHSFVAGIGLFLLFLGLVQTGLVMAGTAPQVPLAIGNLRQLQPQLAIGGFLIIATLLYWRVPGALLVGIAVTAAVGFALGVGQRPSHVAALPFTGEYALTPLIGQLDVRGVLRVEFLPVLLTLFLMSFLDTLGTLVGVGAAVESQSPDTSRTAHFLDLRKPMLVDAASCVFAAVVGTTTSGAYIESATGIREGARTGLAAVTTAVLFALALFFIPLFESFQGLRYAYGPALLAVGLTMIGSVRHIDFDDLTEAVPALTTVAMMVFTYNIANGLTAGLVLYPVLKVAAGRWRELNGGAVVLSLMCLLYYVRGMVH